MSQPTHGLANLGASWAVIGLATAAYRWAPHNRAQVDAVYALHGVTFTGAQFLTGAALVYALLLALYQAFAVAPDAESKSLRAWGALPTALSAPRRLSAEQRLALLATLLKAFFAPLMVMSLMVFMVSALRHAEQLWAGDAAGLGLAALFERHGFWFALQFIVFIDVLVFTFGYLVELPSLRNEIRSVDGTLLGWAAALLCYAPFNQLTATVLGSQSADFPKFDHPTVHLVMNSLLLALMAVYAAASVALGAKASNLTHRGIVARGPYAWVRHPAYTCKNLAWWIGAAPLVSAAFAGSWFEGLQSAASVGGWSLLYVLRAVTEEDHLRRVDGEYAAYAAKTRHRFIPGLI